MTIYSLFFHSRSFRDRSVYCVADGRRDSLSYSLCPSVEEARLFIRVFQRLRIVAIPSFLVVLGCGM